MSRKRYNVNVQGRDVNAMLTKENRLDGRTQAARLLKVLGLNKLYRKDGQMDGRCQYAREAKEIMNQIQDQQSFSYSKSLDDSSNYSSSTSYWTSSNYSSDNYSYESKPSSDSCRSYSCDATHYSNSSGGFCSFIFSIIKLMIFSLILLYLIKCLLSYISCSYQVFTDLSNSVSGFWIHVWEFLSDSFNSTLSFAQSLFSDGFEILVSIFSSIIEYIANLFSVIFSSICESFDKHDLSSIFTFLDDLKNSIIDQVLNI